MTFDELEKICLLLWGRSWQSELARAFNIDRRTVSKWKTQGVAKWVDSKINAVFEKRSEDILKVKEILGENT